MIFQVYDALEKTESVDKSATEIKCGIRRIEAVFERTTTTTTTTEDSYGYLLSNHLTAAHA